MWPKSLLKLNLKLLIKVWIRLRFLLKKYLKYYKYTLINFGFFQCIVIKYLIPCTYLLILSNYYHNDSTILFIPLYPSILFCVIIIKWRHTDKYIACVPTYNRLPCYSYILVVYKYTICTIIWYIVNYYVMIIWVNIQNYFTIPTKQRLLHNYLSW